MKKTKTALVIVAHPDDETIWMGGTILKENFNWTIFSLCRKKDSERAKKFRRVCSFYKAKSIITDIEDEKLNPIKINDLISVINKNLKQKEFDLIFTHGKNGEYGHPRHIELHKTIVAMNKQNILKCKSLHCFSYGLSKKFVPKTKMQIVIPKNSDMNIQLSKKQYEQKQKIINQLYGFGKKSFEYICCNKKESFTKIK